MCPWTCFFFLVTVQVATILAELFTKKKEKRNKLEVEIERIHVIIKIVCNPVSKKQVLSKNIPETFWKERFAG